MRYRVWQRGVVDPIAAFVHGTDAMSFAALCNETDPVGVYTHGTAPNPPHQSNAFDVVQ